ncbi:MAG TPA: hypothetical protein VEZ90_12930 [Blastocatellia bacterium]|nr:hypothetical protein [Blastocatellia bacterium]
MSEVSGVLLSTDLDSPDAVPYFLWYECRLHLKLPPVSTGGILQEYVTVFANESTKQRPTGTGYYTPD